MNTLSELVLPRLPHRPYCTNDLEHGLIIRPASIASRMSHIQLNPPVLRHWLLFDIDTPKAAISWEAANLPPPNWIATNPINTHAHCGYLLETPVITSAAGHDKPLRYAAAIEQAFRLKLRADPGYCGLICKNPLHERWQTWHLHDHAYTLAELAEWVSLAKPGYTEVEDAGLGRNVLLFDSLRRWAYRMVLAYKDADASRETWARAALHEAEGINSRLPRPLMHSEVRSTAKSVARWTWRKFSDQQFSQIQRRRAQRRWNSDKTRSLERSKPWDRLGISRRTYFYRKKLDLLPQGDCTDAISDSSEHKAQTVSTCSPAHNGSPAP